MTPKKVLLVVLCIGLIFEVWWIVTSDRRDPPQSQVLGQTIQSPVPTTTSKPASPKGPVGNPRTVRLGVLVRSEARTELEKGLAAAIKENAEATGASAAPVEVVRCVLAPPQTSKGCRTLFLASSVKAIIANPEVDATVLLKEMTFDGIPYLGALPTTESEFTAPNSYQLGPGGRGILLAPLQWAIDFAAPSIVLVATEQTASARDLFLAAATKAKVSVRSLDFSDSGTDVNRYLTPIGDRKPVLVFLVEPSGCPVILRGVTRRRATLSYAMQATFVPNACSGSASPDDVEGLRLMTARPFSAGSALAADEAFEAARALFASVNEAIPVSGWATGSPLEERLRKASYLSPTSTLGAWNCESRSLADSPAVCGRQVFVVGLGSDTADVGVWIDALRN